MTLYFEIYFCINALAVVFWKNVLLKGNKKNYLKKSEDPIEEMVISPPDDKNKGEWNKTYERRLEESLIILQDCDSVEAKIARMNSKAKRKMYNLEVYEQVNKLTRFAPKHYLQ